MFFAQSLHHSFLLETDALLLLSSFLDDDGGCKTTQDGNFIFSMHRVTSMNDNCCNSTNQTRIMFLFSNKTRIHKKSD